MATVITEECINCGACEPECPNTAIYQGGVEYDWQGVQPALSEDFFYIVPEKCTECVGFFDQEACAAVCPVDCCVPDPVHPETDVVLFARAKELHPGDEFPADYPSRFKSVAGEAPAMPNGAAPEAAPVVPVVPVVPKTAAPPAAAAAVDAGAFTGVAAGRVEKIVAKKKLDLAHGAPTIDFDGELSDDFDTLADSIRDSGREGGSSLLGWGLLALAPGLGALTDRVKRSIEEGYGDTRFFSAQMSTALNVFQNFLLYPVLFYFIGVMRGVQPYTEGDRGFIFLGIAVAVVETCWRLRDSLFGGMSVAEGRLGSAFYGAPLGLLAMPLVGKLRSGEVSGVVPVEGFFTPEFEHKRERERRYGEVYEVQEFDRGAYIRFELPRNVPPSSAKSEMGIPDEMPDYDVDIVFEGENLVISGSVVDEKLRAVCGVSSAFPADFRTEISLDARPSGFRHRYRDKILEILVLKAGS